MTRFDRSARPRVLIVDQSPRSRRHMAGLYQEAGWDVAQVWGGGEALTLVANEWFDLIVLDDDMPLMNGDGLCIHLHREFGNRLPPILVISSQPDDDKPATQFALAPRVVGYLNRSNIAGQLLSSSESCLPTAG